MSGMNRTELKVVAIIAMVCDHIAWGFLDFNTPQAQVMHIIGRLTIPIMCFFIAEGYHKTSNIKKYIGRLILFWLVSILPFYAFFHELYDYRQNILFDLLLGLLTLVVLEKKQLPKISKTALVILLFVISSFLGGWPIYPILCVLTFYYKKDFKSRTKWFAGITIALFAFLFISIWFNQIYHFSQYDWVWYDKIYLLGFILGLPLLGLYNGEKGSSKYMNYFFYIFYPAHFCILALLKMVGNSSDIYYLYVGIQILVILLAFAMLVTVALSRPSKAQTGNIILTIFSIIYMVGFFIEITSPSLEVVCIAIMIEYFGESIMIVALTWFISEFFRVTIPVYIYVAEGVVVILTMTCMLTLKYNNWFYTGMYIDYSGPFHRVALDYGVGFYVFLCYMGSVCIAGIILGIKSLRSSDGVERKREKYMIMGFVCPWLAYLLREIGVTGGFEISSIGILGTIIFVSFSWIRYGYFDSVQLAGENALNHGKEGIMVIGTNYRILYFNHIIEELFADVMLNRDAYNIGNFKEMFEGDLKSIEVNEKIYELRTEPLIESGYTQGYMLWVIDMTQHYNTLKEIQCIAHTDSLTGLNNRSFFRTSLSEFMRLGGTGAMIMLDLDNFKAVNDTQGHGAGDAVLIALSNVLKAAAESEHLTCRIGGDEFCMFFKGITDQATLAAKAENIHQRFIVKLKEIKIPPITSVSIGIAVLNEPTDETPADFDELYRQSDKALYLSKNSGKGTYRFYN